MLLICKVHLCMLGATDSQWHSEQTCQQTGLNLAMHTVEAACGFRAHRDCVHASQGCHDSCSSQNQHSADNDVGQEAEEEEDQMRSVPPTCVHNLQDCMC